MSGQFVLFLHLDADGNPSNRADRRQRRSIRTTFAKTLSRIRQRFDSSADSFLLEKRDDEQRFVDLRSEITERTCEESFVCSFSVANERKLSQSAFGNGLRFHRFGGRLSKCAGSHQSEGISTGDHRANPSGDGSNTFGFKRNDANFRKRENANVLTPKFSSRIRTERNGGGAKQ